MDIFTDNLDWAERMAVLLVARMGIHRNQRQDAIQAAVVAYWLCCERFDPSIGSNVRTFAFARMRGAIIDVQRQERLVGSRRHPQQTVREDILREITYDDVGPMMVDAADSKENRLTAEDLMGYTSR